MLPSKNRLSEFFRSKDLISEPGLRIFFRSNDLSISRFGISIRSGILRKAVQRNHCKRLIREWLRRHLSKIKTGTDFWILVSSGREEDLVSNEFLDKILKTSFSKKNFFILEGH